MSFGILYNDIPLMSADGFPLYTDTSPPPEECCCPAGGCCTGDVLDTDTLNAEVIDATNNCVPIGAEVDMTGSGFIWASVDCLDSNCFNAIQLSCTNEETGFVLTADGTGCVSANPCPNTVAYTAVLISLTCDPLEIIFEITLTTGIPPQCGCCDAEVGVITIRITKVP